MEMDALQFGLLNESVSDITTILHNERPIAMPQMNLDELHRDPRPILSMTHLVNGSDSREARASRKKT